MKNTPWPNEKEPLPLFYALVRRALPLSESFGPPLLLPLLGCPSPSRNSFTPLSLSSSSFLPFLSPCLPFLLPPPPFLDDWEGDRHSRDGQLICVTIELYEQAKSAEAQPCAMAAYAHAHRRRRLAFVARLLLVAAVLSPWAAAARAAFLGVSEDGRSLTRGGASVFLWGFNAVYMLTVRSDRRTLSANAIGERYRRRRARRDLPRLILFTPSPSHSSMPPTTRPRFTTCYGKQSSTTSTP